MAPRCTTSLVLNRHALPESVIVNLMNALFGSGRKLSILLLIACGIAQFSCPFLWSMTQSETVAAVSHVCHENHQAPAPEQKKCCIASHSQQAEVAVRYVAPKLIDNPANAAAGLLAVAMTTKDLLISHNPCSPLRYPGAVLRI